MSSLTELDLAVRQTRHIIDGRTGEAKSVLTNIRALRNEIGELVEDIEVNERATILLNSIGEEKQLQAQQAIEELVTRGLQSIFDETLSFHIRQKTVAKRAEVDFVIRTRLSAGKVVETDVMDARGGGLAATVGFLLRLVVLLLRDNPNDEHLLVLDETFGFVSEDYLPGVAEFLRKIVDRTDIQILMVTHQDSFAEVADVVYRTETVAGMTKLTEVV